ncbi:MAG: YggS family pyridoxal phosphate-dependent enzyme [Phycisphaerae bacterium]|nr:YggS family pyridoxal phosphate-dependent enzyme [Phycisphaerae bacterium]
MAATTETHTDGTTLKQRYASVRERIAKAAQRVGRNPQAVTLCVVSKSASVDQIRELVQLGQADFAENRVQQLVQRAALMDEWRRRREELAGKAMPIRWHMIGTLQRNKVKKAVELSRLIHSVDSLRLAEEIQVAANKREHPVEVLIEVNIAGERAKSGVAPAATRHLMAQIDTMVNVKTRGLMCMGPLEGGVDAARTAFERCRELFEEIRLSGVGGERFDILSMGMSADFEVAVECGSNLVRVGTAVIGPPQVEESKED